MEVKIIRDIVPKSVKNVRPGYKMTPRWITIHETDNTSPGAGARNHAIYLKNGAGGASKSWHFTVDDKEIYQHLPTNEAGWHAGDGANGTGNRQSIGIVICVNRDGNYEKAKENAAWLVRKLMKEHNIPIERVVQHNRWSGKNCPRRMREEGKWGHFLQMIQQGSPAPAPSTNTTVLRLGDSGPAVKKLQEDLLKAGEKLPKYGPDGYFGAETLAAVKSFQKKHGLTVDGIAGPQTLAKLAEVIAGHNQPKKESEDMLKVAVVINSFADFPVAEALANRYKAPIFLRSFATGEFAETVYVVGGTKEGIKAKTIIDLSGSNRFETAYKVGKHLGTL